MLNICAIWVEQLNSYDMNVIEELFLPNICMEYGIFLQYG